MPFSAGSPATVLKKHSGLKIAYRERRINAPDSKNLHRAIFNGEVKTVVVWSLSRLTRKGAYEGLSMLAKWLEKGVRVVAIAEQFDFYGAQGELIAALLFALAKMSRDELSASTKRGLAAAKARGVRLGKRPGKWTAEVQPLHQSGMSPADIARKLGRSRQAVHNVLNGITAAYASTK